MLTIWNLTVQISSFIHLSHSSCEPFHIGLFKYPVSFYTFTAGLESGAYIYTAIRLMVWERNVCEQWFDIENWSVVCDTNISDIGKTEINLATRMKEQGFSNSYSAVKLMSHSSGCVICRPGISGTGAVNFLNVDVCLPAFVHFPCQHSRKKTFFFSWEPYTLIGKLAKNIFQMGLIKEINLKPPKI